VTNSRDDFRLLYSLWCSFCSAKVRISSIFVNFNLNSFSLSCPRFLNSYENAKALTLLQQNKISLLEGRGVQSIMNTNYINATLTKEQETTAFTFAAQLLHIQDVSPSSFEENAVCLNRAETPLQSHPTYITMDGYGNNLKHPLWGNSETKFGRFGPKNFADGVGTIRKTDRLNSYLPAPRELVTKVLKKAKRKARTSKFLNSFWLQLYAALSHDVGHTASMVPAINPNNRVICCSAGNKEMLPRPVRHPGCAPIAIPKDDEFFQSAGVKCQNFVRAQQYSSPTTTEFSKLNQIAIVQVLSKILFR
jgi:hypothetical protein